MDNSNDVPNYIVTFPDLNLNPNNVTTINEGVSLVVVSFSLIHNILQVMKKVGTQGSINRDDLEKEVELAREKIRVMTKKRVLKDDEHNGGYARVAFITIVGIITVSIAIFLFIGNVVIG